MTRQNLYHNRSVRANAECLLQDVAWLAYCSGQQCEIISAINPSLQRHELGGEELLSNLPSITQLGRWSHRNPSLSRRPGNSDDRYRSFHTLPTERTAQMSTVPLGCALSKHTVRPVLITQVKQGKEEEPWC